MSCLSNFQSPTTKLDKHDSSWNGREGVIYPTLTVGCLLLTLAYLLQLWKLACLSTLQCLPTNTADGLMLACRHCLPSCCGRAIHRPLRSYCASLLPPRRRRTPAPHVCYPGFIVDLIDWGIDYGISPYYTFNYHESTKNPLNSNTIWFALSNSHYQITRPPTQNHSFFHLRGLHAGAYRLIST